MEFNNKDLSLVGMLVAQEIGVVWESYTSQKEMEEDGVVPHFIEVNELADRLEGHYGELNDRGWDSVKEAREWYHQNYPQEAQEEELILEDEVINEESRYDHLLSAQTKLDYWLELGGDFDELTDKIHFEIDLTFTNMKNNLGDTDRALSTYLPSMQDWVHALDQMAELWRVHEREATIPVEDLNSQVLGMLYGIARNDWGGNPNEYTRKMFLEHFCHDREEIPRPEAMYEFLNHDIVEHDEVADWVTKMVVKYGK